MEYDVLVIGGGIAGMEASLTLADAGFKVLLVEKSPSIGGKMIQLSKVFPTTDCAGCITTPKMAATSKHENITMMTYAEVKEIKKLGERNFVAKILKSRDTLMRRSALAAVGVSRYVQFWCLTSTTTVW